MHMYGYKHCVGLVAEGMPQGLDNMKNVLYETWRTIIAIGLPSANLFYYTTFCFLKQIS